MEHPFCCVSDSCCVQQRLQKPIADCPLPSLPRPTPGTMLSWGTSRCTRTSTGLPHRSNDPPPTRDRSRRDPRFCFGRAAHGTAPATSEAQVRPLELGGENGQHACIQSSIGGQDAEVQSGLRLLAFYGNPQDHQEKTEIVKRSSPEIMRILRSCCGS